MQISRLRSDQFFSFVFCLVFLLIQGSLLPLEPVQSLSQVSSLELIQLDPIPVVKDYQSLVNLNYGQSPQLSQVTAQSYLVVDLKSASILIEKNKDLPLFPASTVKLMTALLARDIYDLNNVIRVGQEVEVVGHQIGLRPGQEMKVFDLLKAILVNSGNDAAQTLAFNHPFGYEGFIQGMNLKAQALSLTNTYFTNPTGLDDYHQVSTSWDLALLAKEINKDPVLKKLVNLQQASISDVAGFSNYQLYNTNQLLTKYDQAIGIKTGTTQMAGQVLVTLWKEASHELLIVVMGSQDRYQDTLYLVDWVSDNIEWIDYDSP